MSKPITEATRKALGILDVQYGKELSATQFAQLMWPDAEGWTKVSNQGNGACSGKGMWLAAGGYLNKLQRRGLVKWGTSLGRGGWGITNGGKEAMNNYDNQ